MPVAHLVFDDAVAGVGTAVAVPDVDHIPVIHHGIALFVIAEIVAEQSWLERFRVFLRAT